MPATNARKWFYAIMTLLATPRFPAELIVIEPSSFAGLSLVTSTYEFFGPSEAYECGGEAEEHGQKHEHGIHGLKQDSLDLEAVFVSGADLCSPHFSGIDVVGRMVVSYRSDTGCLMTDIYPKLLASGASAFVRIVVLNPPGFLTFYHNTWDACVFCDEPMAMVSTVDPKGIFKELEELSLANTKIKIRLSAKHDTTYRDLFKSPAWVVLMQIVVPLCAWWTSYLSGVDLFRTFRGAQTKKINLRVVIYCVECPVMFFIGVAFVCGQFGPTMLPMYIHASFFTTLLTGTSVFTTLLLVLFLREEEHSSQTNSSRRSIFVLHRRTIFLVAFFLLVWDFASIFMVALMVKLNVPTVIWNLTLGILFVLQIPLQGGIAIYFIVKAVNFQSSFMLYLSSLKLTKEEFESKYGMCPESFVRAGQLVFWLAMSGACMLITSVSGAILVASYTRTSQEPANVVLDLVILFIWALSRIGVSYAQIESLRPTRRTFPKAIGSLQMIPPFGVRNFEPGATLETIPESGGS